MAEQAAEPEVSMWLVEPPARGQVHLSFGMGEGVTMTPELKASIERLLSSLMGAEGLASEDPVRCGGAFNRCDTFTCTLDGCKPLKSAPCYQLVSCRIDLS